MLETEEVDVDYFTPASGTSLAKIFSSNSQTEEENSSLKYIPPLPAEAKQKTDEEKPTQCMYATALHAYEWLKNSYVSKERVGFAIMKIVKTGLHNIVLYDSNKTTLSCLTITTNTEINVKQNVSISYYDNQRKYWTVYTTPIELNKILDMLKGLNVCLKPAVEMAKEAPEKDDTDSKNREQVLVSTRQLTKGENKESDTDSSINRRTKDSILKRMATMGQSVLPTTHLTAVQTTDSSDTNETLTQHKTRHKPFKTINKRNVEKNIESDEQIKNVMSKPILHTEHEMYPNNSQQIIAVKTIDMARTPVSTFSEGNDMTLFLSEQRVNNSEMRINLSRMTDKLDLVLDKVKSLENVDRSYPGNSASQFQNDIVHRLLKEYETKIKNYEEFIKSKGLQCDILAPNEQQGNTNVMDKKIVNNDIIKCNCKQLCEENDREILQLKAHTQLLSNILKEAQNVESNESSLSKEINDLKAHIIMQDNQIFDLNKKLENTLSSESVSNKVKEIMNNAFQNISENFDGETSYTGANVRNIVASVIKKTTMECLKDFK